jgi:hypothetical protein
MMIDKECKVQIDIRHAERLVREARALSDAGHGDVVTIIRRSNMGRAVINRALAINRREDRA